MKIALNFCTSGTLRGSIQARAIEECAAIPLTRSQRADREKQTEDQALEVCRSFLRVTDDGHSVRGMIEIDTDRRTCTLVECER